MKEKAEKLHKIIQEQVIIDDKNNILYNSISDEFITFY